MTDKLEGKGGCILGLVGIAFLIPTVASADPDKSIAAILACRVDGSTTHVCANKELSNIVVQCSDGESESTYFWKYDDLDDMENWPEGQTSPYAGDFECPNGDSLTAVFVKSGRQKYEGTLEGLPPGTGAIWEPMSCLEQESTCPEPGDEEEGEAEGTR